MTNTNCPKCQGPRDAKALYCPFCGTVFSRYVEGSLTMAPVASAPLKREVESEPVIFKPLPAQPRPAPEEEVGIVFDGTSPGPGRSRFDLRGTPFTADLASPLTRLLAQILNAASFVAYLAGFGMVGNLVSSWAWYGNLTTTNSGGSVGLLFGALLWCIHSVGQLAATGQSMGKKWVGIQIVQLNGEIPSLTRLFFFRYLPVQILSIVPLVPLIDCALIFTPGRRSLRDRFASTQVINC